jgi:HEAT repeat protein
MDSHNDDTLVNNLSADALFALASTTDDEEQAWAAIERLRNLATEDVFTQAVRLCHSCDAHERCVGVVVIAQFGLPQQTYHEPVVQLLIQMLEAEEAPTVLESIGIALGHRNDVRAVGPLLQFQQHAEPAVRYGVVFGLLRQTD